MRRFKPFKKFELFKSFRIHKRLERSAAVKRFERLELIGEL